MTTPKEPTMPNNEELIALAERVEAASGPDRQLDLDIFWAVKSAECGEEDDALPQYTGSIDAAWTLLPDDDISLTREGTGGSDDPVDWVADLTMLDRKPQSFDLYVRAATPALALTAACLRARAAA
jgi:hypothetical protein